MAGDVDGSRLEPTLEQILSHYGLERSALDRRCTQDIGDHIFKRLSDWQSAGRYLGFPQERLVAISVENRTEDQRKITLYEEWIQRNGKQATYLRLVEALYKHGRRDLAETLCGRVVAATPPMKAPAKVHKPTTSQSVEAEEVVFPSSHTPKGVRVVPREDPLSLKEKGQQNPIVLSKDEIQKIESRQPLYSGVSGETQAVLHCTSDLTSLLKHNLFCSGKLLEKGLITKDVHDWILTAQGVSNQDKASRLVSCLADKIKDSSRKFHEFIEVLKETDPFCGDVVDKLTSIQSSFSALNILVTSEEEKKQAIEATINNLEKQFSNLQRRLLSELTAKSNVSPEVLVDSLTLLPIALRSQYQKIILENFSTLEKADSIRKVFYYLNPHFSFIDYHLIEYLVKEFGTEMLQEDMSVYVEAVQVFLAETTVLDLMDHWPGQLDIPPHFEELRAVIDGDPSMYTLQQLDNLRKRFCVQLLLSRVISVLIGIIRRN